MDSHRPKATQKPPLDPKVKLPPLGAKFSPRNDISNSGQGIKLDGRDVFRKELERWGRKCRPPINITTLQSSLAKNPKFTVYGEKKQGRRPNALRCPWFIRIEGYGHHCWKVTQVLDHHTEACIQSRLEPHSGNESDSNSEQEESNGTSSASSEVQVSRRRNVERDARDSLAKRGRKIYYGASASRQQHANRRSPSPSESRRLITPQTSQREDEMVVVPETTSESEFEREIQTINLARQKSEQLKVGRIIEGKERLQAEAQKLFPQAGLQIRGGNTYFQVRCGERGVQCPFLIRCKPLGFSKKMKITVSVPRHNHPITSSSKGKRVRGCSPPSNAVRQSKSRPAPKEGAPDFRKRVKYSAALDLRSSAPTPHFGLVTPSTTVTASGSSSRSARGEPNLSKYTNTPLHQVLKRINPNYLVWVEPLINAGADPHRPEELINLEKDLLMDMFAMIKRRVGEGETELVAQGELIEMPPIVKIVLTGSFRQMKEKMNKERE